METIKTSTKALLVSAFVLLVILATSPLGYRLELVPLSESLQGLVVAMVGGVAVLGLCAVYMVRAVRGNLPTNRNWLALAMALSLVPVIVVLPQLVGGRSVPSIHDITTDTANPPPFVALLDVRKRSPNGAKYGASDEWPANKLAEAQQQAYPDLAPIMSNLPMAAAVARAEAVLQEMGLQLAGVDVGAGLLEATATTFWFGFKDDMVVRVTAVGDGSRVDIRSMSRVGQSDLGVNAARIADFIARF
ncbi:MAG: DUF1499 domain-containing protein [Pseudomonadales bacterium]